MPSPAAPPPVAFRAPEEALASWGTLHPEAARELCQWVQHHDDAARRLFEWDDQHPDRSHELVSWTVSHPGQELDTFLSGHRDWPELDPIARTSSPPPRPSCSGCAGILFPPSG